MFQDNIELDKSILTSIKKLRIVDRNKIIKIFRGSFVPALIIFSIILISDFSLTTKAQAQSYKPAMFSDLQWRGIGPLRGGRMHALDAVPGNPTIFYAGADNGGIWKSTSY